MTATVALVSILAFLVVFWLAGVVGAARKAVSTASGAAKVVTSKELDDETKERETQKAAIGLLGSVVSITWRSALALIAAAVPIYAADAAALTPSADVIEFLSRWDVIIVVSVVIVAAFLLGRRLWPAR